MKIKIPIILSLLLIGVIARADVSPPALTVAVYDFTATGEAVVDLGQDTNNWNHWNASKWNAWRTTLHDFEPKVTALVTADLSAETNLVLVERAELNKALNEQAFGLSGMINSGVATKIGQMTGAKVLVAGQIFASDDGRLTIVANIIGTETTRLYAVKVEGAADKLMDLTDDLSRKIAQKITEQATNLLAAQEESEAERLDAVIQNLKGTNRPVVSVNILMLRADAHAHSIASEDEFGAILLKAGFTVVDQNSEQKPDLEITGVANFDLGTKHGELSTCSGETELKVQERRTGKIIIFDRQQCSVTDPSERTANRAVQAKAVNELAERLLPLLAK